MRFSVSFVHGSHSRSHRSPNSKLTAPRSPTTAAAVCERASLTFKLPPVALSSKDMPEAPAP